VAELVAFTGQSFADTWDRTTWSDYLAINDQWKRVPPAAVALARLAGMAPLEDDTPVDEATDAAMREANIAMLSEFAGPPPKG